MDLFGHDPTANLLPCDGVVNYFGAIVPHDEAWRFFDVLRTTIPWKNDEVVINGQRIVTSRQVAWYGDSAFRYTYSGTTKQALTWTSELFALKAIVEERTGTRFNSCLLNFYRDGGEGMSWHSDDEKSLGPNTTIASVSFGAERKFCFRHKRTRQETSVILEHGSLLVMKGATQTNWLHALPKTARVTTPRINLTFRTIVDQG